MKKNITALAILLFMCLTTSAQSLIVNTTDKATGNRIIKTNNHEGPKLDVDESVVKSGILFFSAGYQSAKAGNKLVASYFIDLDIMHNDSTLGCLQEFDSRIILTLEDGTKVECFQISESDCDKVAFHASFALMPKAGKIESMKENFEKLMTTAITEMIIVTTERKLEYKTKKSSRDLMKKHFALIDKTVKSNAK